MRLIKALSVFLLVWQVSSVAWAQPVLDGSGCHFGITPGNSTGSCNITTSSTNDVIVVGTFSRNQAATSNQISTVTASGLTFTKLIEDHAQLVGSGGTGDCASCSGDASVWTAPSSGTLSAVAINATYASNMDVHSDGNIVVMAVNGVFSTATPFDTNGALPSETKNVTGAAQASPNVTISTSQPKDLLMLLHGGIAGGTGGACPAGFTAITDQTAVHSQQAAMCVKGVTSTQSSQTFTMGIGATYNWFMFGWALTASAPGGATNSLMFKSGPGW